MSDVAVTWVQNEQFIASGGGGHSIVVDALGAGLNMELGRSNDYIR